MYTLAPGEAWVPAPHIFDTFNTEQKSTRIKVRVDNDSHSLRKWLPRVETLHRRSAAYVLESRESISNLPYGTNIKLKKGGNDDASTSNRSSRHDSPRSTHAWPTVPFICICIFGKRLARYHQFIMHHHYSSCCSCLRNEGSNKAVAQSAGGPKAAYMWVPSCSDSTWTEHHTSNDLW